MDLATSPLFERLQRADHVLLAGAGGGFDIYCGLPLYFRLRAMGKRVSLANLSFTVLDRVDGRVVAPGLMEVRAETQGSKLCINPLMSMYWAFDLDAVARRRLYLDQLRDTNTSWEISARIESFRARHPSKPWEDIPV